MNTEYDFDLAVIRNLSRRLIPAGVRRLLFRVPWLVDPGFFGQGEDLRVCGGAEPFGVFLSRGGQRGGPLFGLAGGETVVDVSGAMEADTAMAVGMVIPIHKPGDELSGVAD